MRPRLASALGAIAMFVLAAGGGAADLSPAYAEFPKGPAQWLMTADDKRGWNDVKTDAEAQDFIDLFWARRDPTPGTPRNEFKEEFESRVLDADASFTIGNKRGALTDMGRVYILLGPPKNFLVKDPNTLNNPMGRIARAGTSGPSTDDANSRRTFDYDNPFSLELTGSIVFLEKLRTHEYRLDPTHSNVVGALSRAVQKAIVSPDLKEVPDWASSKRRDAELGQIHDAQQPAAPGISEVPAAASGAAAPVVAGAPPGIRRLVLVKDLDAIADASGDPLASVASTTAFGRKGELGYVFDFCSPAFTSPVLPPVKMTIAVGGVTGGGKLTINVPSMEVRPEAVAALPGCGVVKGSIPLSSFKPGTYTFTLTVIEPGSERSYTRHRDLTIE